MNQRRVHEASTTLLACLLFYPLSLLIVPTVLKWGDTLSLALCALLSLPLHEAIHSAVVVALGGKPRIVFSKRDACVYVKPLDAPLSSREWLLLLVSPVVVGFVLAVLAAGTLVSALFLFVALIGSKDVVLALLILLGKSPRDLFS